MIAAFSSKIITALLFIVIAIKLVHAEFNGALLDIGDPLPGLNDKFSETSNTLFKLDNGLSGVSGTLPVTNNIQSGYEVGYSGLDDEEFEQSGLNCPEEIMAYYKDCKTPIVSCVNCIQAAEKKCNYEERSSYRNFNGACANCRNIYTDKCGRATSMCFGYQDCGGRNGGRNGDGRTHCINFKCVYLGKIKYKR